MLTTTVGGVDIPAGTTVMNVLGAANRDPRAFEALYRKYVAQVYNFALYELRDPHAAEDLTAQVESVQFHATKIEYLVDNLYAFNRRLTALGGQMLRQAGVGLKPAVALRVVARSSVGAASEITCL